MTHDEQRRPTPVEVVRTALEVNGFDVDETLGGLGPFFVSLHRQGYVLVRAAERDRLEAALQAALDLLEDDGHELWSAAYGDDTGLWHRITGPVIAAARAALGDGR